MRCLILVLALAAASPAVAEVKSASANAFVVEQRMESPLNPSELYARVGQVGRWWNKEHTYSGDAGNLSLELKPGGCFCEKLPAGGGVEHMRVSYAEPGKRLVLSGALGPMLYEAVAGVMDIQIKPAAQGSELVLTYRAAGFAGGNADRLAPAVDQVLGEQVASLKAFASAR